MALTLNKVHTEQVDGQGRSFITTTAPYVRFAKDGDIAVICQKGRFYGDGGAVIEYADVPDHVWGTISRMTSEGLAKYGLQNWEELQAIKRPTANAVQNLNGDSGGDQELIDMLNSLDHSEDAAWTKGGLPDLNYLKEALGRYVKRDAVDVAMPGFTRKEE